MAFRRLFLAIFGMRAYSNYQMVPFPSYFVMLGILGISFVAYVFGSTQLEYEFMHTVLAAFGICCLVMLMHSFHPALGGWTLVTGMIALVMFLIQLWQLPGLLHLLVLPVVLSFVLLKIPAGLLSAATASLLVANFTRIFPALFLAALDRTVLYITIWLAALVMGAIFAGIERLMRQASEDYDRMQSLLENSRLNQVQLSEALDDLAHANRQLSLLYDKNISLRKISEEATQAKTNYIARVSHEIRTPLNMILGITESIIENEEVYEGEVPLDLLDDIRIIQRNSGHLLSLVNDVLDLTRAETSQLVLHREWIDLAVEIAKSVEIVVPLARKKHIELHADLPAALPTVFCDATRIRQVILNLVSNAVRYTEQGRVSISARWDEKWLIVSVEDTGAGIDPEDAERVFEPFYRGKAGASQQAAGSGLGLSVSRQLVELHGGKIWLESRPGRGSTFFFRLPLAQEEPAVRSPVRFVNEQWIWVERKRERTAAFTPSQQKKMILYAVDDQILDYIQQANPQFEVVRVKTIAGLIDEFRMAPSHLIAVNAASFDELLPLMGQVTSQIKDTPVVGSLFTSLRQQIHQAGVASYLQKPFSNQHLREAVSHLLPAPRRILIVDDNTDMQKLMARVLGEQFEDVEFCLASSGEEALKQLCKRPIDVVLLDIALPDVDGWQVLEKIRQDPELSRVPVILVSAHDLSSSPNRSKAMIMMQGEGILLKDFLNQMAAYSNT